MKQLFAMRALSTVVLGTVLSIVMGTVVTVGGGALARADEPHPTCIIRVIHAGGQIVPGAAPSATPEISAPRLDPRIDRLRPYLLRPPFTSWREFQLLDSKTLELQPLVPQSFQLPNGKNIAVTFLEHLPDTKGKHHRVRLQIEIGAGTPVSLKTVFIVDEGGLVLQAGQPHRHGMLVLGTSCTEDSVH